MELINILCFLATTILLAANAEVNSVSSATRGKRTRRYADKDCCETYNAGLIRTHGRIWNTGVWKEHFAAIDCPSMRCCDPKRVMAVRYFFIYTFQCILRKRVIQPCIRKGGYIANTDLFAKSGFDDVFSRDYEKHHGVFCCPGSKARIVSGDARDHVMWAWTKDLKIQCM